MLTLTASPSGREILLFVAGLVALFGGFTIAISIIKYDPECRVTYCMDKPIAKNDRHQMVLTSLYVFYLHILLCVSATFLIRRIASLNNFFRRRPSFRIGRRQFHVALSVGEIVFLATAAGVMLWKFAYFQKYYFRNGVVVKKPNNKVFTWFNLFTHAVGNPLDMFIGYVLLPVSRNSPIATLLQIPFDGALKFHRLIGYAMFAWAVMHATSFFVKLGHSLQSAARMLLAEGVENKDFHAYRDLMGLVAFSCFVIGFVSSLPYIRRKHFNTFYVLHGFMLLMVLFACLHGVHNFYFAALGIVLWCVDIAIRIADRFMKKGDKGMWIDKIVEEGCGYLRVDLHTAQPIPYQPTQYIFLNVPTISALEYHPFSICSASETSLSLLIGPSPKTTEWTSKLRSLTSSNLKGNPTPTDIESVSSRIPVHIEGPFGHCSIPLSQTDILACFVTGTGIAPALGIADYIHKSGSTSPKKLLIFWSLQEPAQAASHLSYILTLLADLPSKVEFHIFDTSTHELSITTVVESTSKKTLDTHVLDLLDRSITMTPRRMNPSELFGSHIAPCVKKNLALRLGVFICAKGGLSKSVRDAVADWEEGKHRSVWVHEEGYEF